MRTSGILMPIFSLPSEYGIGTLGKEAYRFVDFLKKSGQRWWQVLPVGPTGFGDSPYQSFSVMAGNPYFIDLDILCEQKWLTREELAETGRGKDTVIDYGELYRTRFPLLRKAHARFRATRSTEYEVFCRFHHKWLDDYALFMAIKDSLNGCSFDCWPDALKTREPQALADAKERLAESVDFYKTLQFFFYRQWNALKTYANKNGVYLIGDTPIYAAYDSADVWANPQLFLLDDDLSPTAVAGCPPDVFSDDGQLWGNPLYRWDVMKKDRYGWWQMRFRQAFVLFDRLRIDHFRAYSAYYSIPYGDPNAKRGQWVKGPGEDFFRVMREDLGETDIIAEDLGTLDDDVRELLTATGFPGMKVLQFAFDPDAESDYLPHNVIRNCVVYTGTHDNDTAVGWAKDGGPDAVKYARAYLRIDENDSFNWGMISAAMATPAETVILQMQDFLGLDNEARINTPSTASGNWCWRINHSCINDWLANIIYETTARYRRLPKKETKSIQ